MTIFKWTVFIVTSLVLAMMLVGSITVVQSKGSQAPAACSDSDGGRKLYRQGTVDDVLGSSYPDSCASDAELIEYSCDPDGEVQMEQVACPNGCQDGACQGPNVIVVGWDGTQIDHLRQCYNKELPECANGLPNLEALSGGAIFDLTVTSGGTNTKPGWGQILSGYNAEVIRVYDNMDYHPIPEGYSIFEKFEDYFGQNEAITMFISGKYTNTGGACIGEPTVDANDNPVIEEYGQPWCLIKDNLDYFEIDLQDNLNVGSRALSLLEANQNDLFFALFLFGDPDETGHNLGENSREYSAMLIDGDMWLGRIVEKLQELGIYNNTVIFVTSDHGFGEGFKHHANAPFAFVASNYPGIQRSGDRKDLAPTILERLSISRGALGSAPPVDGFSLYSPVPYACVPEGEAYLDYAGAPACCTGFDLIGLDRIRFGRCIAPSGGVGNDSGYCTNCGDGVCSRNENLCNCPQDCPILSTSLIPIFQNNSSK